MNSDSHTIRGGTVTRYVEAGGVVVAVDVPVIYAPEQPDEPLLEAETIRLLDEIQRRAIAGDRAYLSSVGRVFEPAHT